MQRKHIWTNVRLVLVPLFLCLLLFGMQFLIDYAKKSVPKVAQSCGSNDVLPSSDCPIPNPPLLPPMLEIPEPQSRAVKANLFPYDDLPDMSCRKTGTCPVTILITGNNQSLGQGTCFITIATIFYCCRNLSPSCFFVFLQRCPGISLVALSL